MHSFFFQQSIWQASVGINMLHLVKKKQFFFDFILPCRLVYIEETGINMAKKKKERHMQALATPQLLQDGLRGTLERELQTVKRVLTLLRMVLVPPTQLMEAVGDHHYEIVDAMHPANVFSDVLLYINSRMPSFSRFVDSENIHSPPVTFDTATMQQLARGLQAFQTFHTDFRTIMPLNMRNSPLLYSGCIQTQQMATPAARVQNPVQTATFLIQQLSQIQNQLEVALGDLPAVAAAHGIRTISTNNLGSGMRRIRDAGILDAQIRQHLEDLIRKS
jgi:hypothetical protein